MAKKSLKVNDLLGALNQLAQFITNHNAQITAKGLTVTALHTTITGSIAALQSKEQAQEDAKAALKTATATLDGEVLVRYPEFSSLVDLPAPRGAKGRGRQACCAARWATTPRRASN